MRGDVSAGRTDVAGVLAGAVCHGVDTGLQDLQDGESLSVEAFAGIESSDVGVEEFSRCGELVQLSGLAVACCGVEPELRLDQIVEPLALVFLFEDRRSSPSSELGPEKSPLSPCAWGGPTPVGQGWLRPAVYAVLPAR
ncbi:hypothetical protein GCM10009576_079570 [Streptomyces rhizosphaericus]|uniref:Uncharacterized protein n=1 Tax=Streptomyces rhizosphaericus TaxID=114699 RepID=A0ABN1SLE7_9ACTN